MSVQRTPLARLSRRASVLIFTLSLPLWSGCSTQAPCLSYQTQAFTRTVSMRGYGSIQVTEEARVCTERDYSLVSRDSVDSTDAAL